MAGPVTARPPVPALAGAALLLPNESVPRWLTPARRWAAATLIVLVAGALHWLSVPFTDPTVGFAIAGFAAALAALLGGFWPGAWVTALGAAALLAESLQAGPVVDTPTLVRLLLLVPFGLLVAALSQVLQKSFVRKHRRVFALERAAADRAHLQTALGEGEVGLAELDGELRYTWVHGPPSLAADKWLGKTAVDLSGALLGEPLMEAQRRVLASGVALRGDFALVTHAGTRYLAHSLTPIFGHGEASARIEGLRSVFADVTEAHAQRARQKNELALFKAAQELSLDAFELLEPVRLTGSADIADFTWTYINPAGEALLGASARARVGLRVLSDHPGDAFLAARFLHWQEVMRDGRPRRADFTRDDGERSVPCQTLSVALGERLAVTTRDASEQARSLQAERAAHGELQRSVQLKDEFLANLSHELRTPLNAIAGWVHVLSHANTDAALVQRAAEAIERNTRAQASLIDNLLDMSRLTSGTLRIERAPLDLGDVLRGAVEALQPAASAKWIAIDTRGIVSGVQCLGEPARLAQVFANLLGNAVKYTPVNGHIEVRMRPGPRSVCVDIVDNGAGIEPALLPRLFTRFMQGDGSISRSQNGLGIGLALARSLAELHGGSLCITSEGLGKGSHATVELPLLDVPHGAPKGRPEALPAPPPDEPRSAERGPSLATSPPATDAAGHAAEPRPPTAAVSARDTELPLAWRRILVLEDEADALELMSLLLRQQGAIVRAFDQPEQALAAAENGMFDLVISDLGLPGMDGLEFMRRLREHPLAPKAIALTAYSDHASRAQALAAGYAHVEFKPIVAPQFLARVIAEIASKDKAAGAA